MRYLIEVYESGETKTDCVIYFGDLYIATVALESFRLNTSDDFEIGIGVLTDNDLTYYSWRPEEYEWMESSEAFAELVRTTLHLEAELGKDNTI